MHVYVDLMLILLSRSSYGTWSQSFNKCLPRPSCTSGVVLKDSGESKSDKVPDLMELILVRGEGQYENKQRLSKNITIECQVMTNDSVQMQSKM